MKFFRSGRTHEDFADEVQAHLDIEADRLMAAGLSDADARAEAARAFGNVTRVKERFYETSRWPWFEQFAQDLRYAWRGIRHAPAFVATTVLTLGVAIGLLTVAFAVFNAYVLRPFAVRDAEGLHLLVWRSQDSGGQGFRWQDYEEIARRTDLVEAIGDKTTIVSSNGRPLMTSIVSPNYFESLAPAIQRGRGLGRADADGTGAVVVTDQAWSRLFGRDENILGRTLDLNGRAHTVVGVLSPAFTGLGDVPRDVFVTVPRAGESSIGTTASEERATEVFLRLQPGVSTAQASAALVPVVAAIQPDEQGLRVEVRPHSSPNQGSTEMLVIMAPVFAAFVLVLVTACANVSNIMLARALARHREIAVRLSIGASRGRIVRQLLTEGLLIAALAGAAGLLIAAWTVRLALAAIAGTLPPSVAPILRFAPLTFDARVFLFACAVSAVTVLLFALAPALQATRAPLTNVLRTQGGGTRTGARLRGALVVGQVAVAVVLVVTAATLTRNGLAIGSLDVGFTIADVTSINVRGGQSQLARRLADTLSTDPRISRLAVTSGNPLFNHFLRLSVTPADRPDTSARAWGTFVSPEFFDLLRLPVLRGRSFRPDEAGAEARVAIVSTATAQGLWPGVDAVGRTLRIERANGRSLDELPDYAEVTVVGVVRDIVSGMMVNGPDPGHIYLPTTTAGAHAEAILFQTRTAEGIGPEAMDSIFRRVAPDPQVFEVIPLDDIRALQMYPLLVASWIGTLLGALALALSVSGLYGVLTYTLNQRQKEIGIRLALGATGRAVVALILRQSARLAGIGAAAGLVVAFATLKLLDAQITLAAVSLLNPAPFAAAAALVVAATLLAAYHPARRASRVDPFQTLRAEQ